MATLREILAARAKEAEEDVEVEIQTLWTPNAPWGGDTFRIDGKLYRRATKRESPDFTIETDYGDVPLRQLTRRELREARMSSEGERVPQKEEK